MLRARQWLLVTGFLGLWAFNVQAAPALVTYKQLAYVAADGHIHELLASTNGSWRHVDLSSLAGAPPADGRGLVSYIWGPSKQIAYLTADGHVHELSCSSKSPGWFVADLSALAGAPPADGRGLVAYTWDKYKQVAYLTADGHVHELFAEATGGWHHADLTVLAGAPAADGRALVAYTWSKHKQVAYLTADGHIHELFAAATGGWHHADLTDSSKAPVADGRGLVGYAWDIYKQIAYLTADGRIHELMFSSQVPGWHEGNLTSLADAPPASGLGLTEWNLAHTKNLAYLGVDNQLHWLLAGDAKGWTDRGATKDVAPFDRRAIVSNTWKGSQLIAYVDSVNHVHELSTFTHSKWEHADLTASFGAAASTSQLLTAYTWAGPPASSPVK